MCVCVCVCVCEFIKGIPHCIKPTEQVDLNSLPKISDTLVGSHWITDIHIETKAIKWDIQQ